jgi:threonyl-tRNA synthetase
VVCTIVSDADDYARKVQAALEKVGLIVDLDLRNEKIGYKVREHSLAKVPVVLAVGKRDQEGGTVALRYLGEEAQKVLPLEEAVRTLTEQARSPLENTH